MCRFKLCNKCEILFSDGFQYILCVGSRGKGKIISLGGTRFQYILCVGSSCELEVDINHENCFNTSYVSVQGLLTKVVQLFTLVSIHPMCRFKADS